MRTNTASLGQNIPNPFLGKTIIPYFVPDNSRSAAIQIVSATGVVIKTITLDAGNGTIAIDALQLPSGAYTYSLTIDGKIIDTKQMMIAK